MSAIAYPPRPKPVAPPRPLRWTLAQYRELGTFGWFADLRTILLRGEIFVMPLPDPPHNLSLGLVEDWLRTVFTTGHHVRSQMALDVGTDTDPGPDVAVVAGTRRDLADRQPTSAVLVVEVADSSLDQDTTTKAELYATAGVPDYWVLDLENRQLHVFRNPQPLPAGLGATAYRSHTVHAPTDAVSPLAAPTATVTVADLLP